jgi:hypothetical protein
MVRWIILGVIVVVASAAATVLFQVVPSWSSDSANGLAFPAPAKGVYPKVVVDGDLKYNFGMMRLKDKGHKSWTLLNKGEADLMLKMVSSTCSCTIANLKVGETATVKPGESTEITLEWTTKSVGSFDQSAEIGTNDPTRPVITLAVSGEVRPAVTLIPSDQTLNFLEISNETEDHRAWAGIYSVDKDDLAITRTVSSKPDAVLVETEPMPPEDLKKLEAKQGIRINVIVKSDKMPIGSFREMIEIETNHPQQPKLELYVTGKMTGPISLSPERVWAHGVPSRTGASQEIKLLVRGQKETKFEVQTPPKPIKVEVVPGNKFEHASQYRLIVTVPPETEAGTYEGKITLKTDHPKAAEVEIPYSIFVEWNATALRPR